MSLTFAALRASNLTRCRRWHHAGAVNWTFDDWLLAMCGEAGEALNVVKKLNRDRDGFVGNTRSRDELLADLGAELADVVIYLDILVGWDQPDVLLGSQHDPADSDADFSAFVAWSKQVAAQGQDQASPSRLGNLLIAAIGTSIYGPAPRGWMNRVLNRCWRLADHFGIDLEAAVIAKFNATSEKFGFPERLVA